jgi:DNA polymerase-3 subunit gamma/tau
LPIADVQLFYQIAIMGRRDLNLSPDPRSGAEMTLLRMLAFRPADAADVPVGSGDGGASATRPNKVVQTEPSRTASQSKAPESAQPSQAWTEPDWSVLVATLGLTGDSLAERLSSHFGESLQIDIELGADAGETPVQEESRMADERMEAARQTLEADPNVQALKNMFGAELKTDSIELIKPSQSD